MRSRRRKPPTTTNIHRNLVGWVEFLCFHFVFAIFIYHFGNLRKFLLDIIHYGWRAIRSNHSRVVPLWRECWSELARIEANSGKNKFWLALKPLKNRPRHEVMCSICLSSFLIFLPKRLSPRKHWKASSTFARSRWSSWKQIRKRKATTLSSFSIRIRNVQSKFTTFARRR